MTFSENTPLLFKRPRVIAALASTNGIYKCAGCGDPIIAEGGNLLPIDQIPEDVRKCISALDCDAGVLKRVRFHDKLKGIELLSRSLGMLRDRTALEFERPVTLAELLSDPPQRALPEAPKPALNEARERDDVEH